MSIRTNPPDFEYFLNLGQLVARYGAARQQLGHTMVELYMGRRGLAVTVADSEAAAVSYQEELMEAGTGWFRVCHADGAITLAATGLASLTFETEGNVDVKAMRLAHARGGNWTYRDLDLDLLKLADETPKPSP